MMLINKFSNYWWKMFNSVKRNPRSRFVNSEKDIFYTNHRNLLNYVNKSGQIMSSLISRIAQRKQHRMIRNNIERARYMAYIPYIIYEQNLQTISYRQQKSSDGNSGIFSKNEKKTNNFNYR